MSCEGDKTYSHFFLKSQNVFMRKGTFGQGYFSLKSFVSSFSNRACLHTQK